MTLAPRQFLTLMEKRAATYGLLSRFYRLEVDKELLDQMKCTRYELDIDIQDIVEGYRLWSDYLSSNTKQSLTDLAVDYARIFIGVEKNAKSVAYPYESVYTSPDRLLMQEAWHQVRALYQAEGLSTVVEFQEPEDHIAVEFEFMAYLIKKGSKTIDVGEVALAIEWLNKQRLFLDQHLLGWTPAFCSDTLRTAREDLYKGLSLVTRGFLKLDREVVEDLINEISSFWNENGEKSS